MHSQTLHLTPEVHKPHNMIDQSEDGVMKSKNVFLSSSSSVTKRMKHPSSQTKGQEFSLGSALEVRCANTTSITFCGECGTCVVTQKVRQFKEWFFRFGDSSKKQFMLGLLRRIKSKAILENIILLLQPTVTKDCIYARARSNPSLKTDTATVSSDHAICDINAEQVITGTWDWFSCANYWTKLNFTLSLLQVCEAHLLQILYRQSHTLLAAELKATETLTDDKDEVMSIMSSEHSHLSNEHQELGFLSISRFKYTPILENPFTGETILKESQSTRSECCSADSLSDISNSSFDPMILVMPTSAKAYAGVSRHKDFIRCLPVHLSKMILSMLDMASLYNALCVSPNWRTLAEEVKLEIGVNQQIREEVMLMQGAAAQSANPVYAKDIDVLVPNLEPGTYDVIYTDDAIIKTTFKSEYSFQTAYSGISTRKVIMEERNVYCGTYNVLVIIDTADSHRVIHTDGSNQVAVGTKDRKVRFVDCDTGKETGPVITGHAGSVTCCYLLQDRDIVISGSYDTSVSVEMVSDLGTHSVTFVPRVAGPITLNAHAPAGTVRIIPVSVWSLETGKCQKTFKHRAAVVAVAVSEEVCISGCERGKVKVWELGSGDLIKILTGHHDSVMSIKFDRWHIITGGKDGYALVWSTVGHHSRCLSALRHPKEVLCLEFAYLRVVTGSADGRIRIWNMVTGKCCRIMRGNSQSDPILSIIAIEDRITVNTLNSLLVMNFEKVNWDYSLETDKVSPRVKYGSYSEAPLRPQSYPYVRAQRMRKAGASNYKIVHHSSPLPEANANHILLQHQHRALQLSHSARSLSSKSLQNAKRVQSSLKSLDASSIFADASLCASPSPEIHNIGEQFAAPSETKISHPHPLHSAAKSKPVNKPASPEVNGLIKQQSDDYENKGIARETSHISRRISWAFDKPLVPKGKDISLSEMKALLRSQLRMKAENIVPPDFIYLTVSTIQKSMVKSETNYNTKMNMRDWKINQNNLQKRPTSSPSRIDPRTKVPADKLRLHAFHTENKTAPKLSDVSSALALKANEQLKPHPFPSKECFTTICSATPIHTSLQPSLHPDIVKTTIPRGQIIRPVSAGPKMHENRQQASLVPLPPRPFTTPVNLRSASVKCIPLGIASSLPGAGHLSQQKSKSDLLSSTSQEASHVPMIMYTKEVKEKIAKLKDQRKSQQTLQEGTSDGRTVGRVSMYNHPLREHIKFELLTHQQEEEHLVQTELFHADQKRKENEELQKKKKVVWLALATGKLSESAKLQICENTQVAE